MNELQDKIKRRTMKPSQAGQVGRCTGISSHSHSSTSVKRVTGRKAWALPPWFTQAAAARPGLLRSFAEVERIHLYHYNIFEPRRHKMDTIRNKTMMPLPEEFSIDLSVREVTAIGCSLSAKDLEVYSELPQHFH